jgi:hypothetical protein
MSTARPRWFTRAFWIPVAVLAVAELVCRVFYADGFTGRFEYGYLPGAGFFAVDGGVELRRSGGRRFYPQAFDMPKPAGRVRVFTVGDSVTRGDDVGDAYPKQLEKVLRARGHDVESLNLGLTAYGATRKRIVALQTLQYQPDILVLHVNEANEGFDERDWNRAESYRSWHPRNWFLKSYALHRLYEARTDSLFWKFLPEPIRTLRSVRTPDAAFAAARNDPARLAEWNRRTREKTAETVREVTAAGVPVILISAAFFDRRHPELTDDGLGAFAEGLTGPRVRHVSTLKVFVGQPLTDYFTDGLHLTPAGHRRLAEELADASEALLKR